MREIGRDVGIEIFSVDVAICASNRQLSLKPFRATVIPRSSSRFPFSLNASLFLSGTTCRHGPQATSMSGGRRALRARCMRERNAPCICVHVSRGRERERERERPRESRVIHESRARSHIHALCHAKNCRRHIGCASKHTERRFLSCV